MSYYVTTRDTSFGRYDACTVAIVKNNFTIVLAATQIWNILKFFFFFFHYLNINITASPKKNPRVLVVVNVKGAPEKKKEKNNFRWLACSSVTPTTGGIAAAAAAAVVAAVVMEAVAVVVTEVAVAVVGQTEALASSYTFARIIRQIKTEFPGGWLPVPDSGYGIGDCW